MSEYIYNAFISYSHRDLSWGKWLQRRLETFRLPRGLSADWPAGKRLKVFRDQTDLAGVGLQGTLRQELAASEYLVVICSPQSAVSEWVNAEVMSFVFAGRADHIIPFIVEGEPESDNPELECFPPALKNATDDELLGVNIQEIGRSKAFLKLVSIILDVRFNRLVDREKKRKRRTILLSLLVTAAVGGTGGFMLWRNAVISEKNQALSYDIYGAALVSIAEKDVFEPADIAFLRVSAEAGNVDAMLLLSDCLRKGWGVEQDLEGCFYWCKKGAEAGNPQCMIALANCYSNGEGTEKDLEASYAWNLKSAEAGAAEGMLNAGICCEDGLGTEADPAQAFSWYKKSAEAGYDLGIYNLARCYMSGTGTEQDQDKAFYWMKKLAETGNAEGMYNMGLMYQYGFGTEEDPAEAYAWYRKAAEAGDPDGAYRTAWCIENSYGTEDQAREWYERAAALGSAEAQKRIAELDE